MPNFFVENDAFSEDTNGLTVSITGEDARHIARSLRCAVGETLTVASEGSCYSCRILTVTDELVTLYVLSRIPSSEPPYFVTVYQCMPKGDKLETVVMKSVECGACAIVPVLSERCVSRPDTGSAIKKTARLQKIADEAAKQSGRASLPAVGTMMSFTEAVDAADKSDLKLFFAVTENTVPLRDVLKSIDFTSGMKIAVFIGPEGDYSDRELDLVGMRGFKLCGLGKRILRCETAAQYVLACLSYEFERE